MESLEHQLKHELISLQERFEELLSKVKTYEQENKFSSQKMKIYKPFSGHYMQPYNDMEYRRTKYNSQIIWEYLDKSFGQWFVIDDESESERLENIFKSDCIVDSDSSSSSMLIMMILKEFVFQNLVMLDIIIDNFDNNTSIK